MVTGKRTFPPEARLHNAADFAGLRKCREPLRGRFFVIRHVPGSGDTARLGLAVSRKTSKRAVERNRLKRAVRESFRQCRADLPVVDLLVITRSAAATASSEQLGQELERHWTQLKRHHHQAESTPPTSRRT